MCVDLISSDRHRSEHVCSDVIGWLRWLFR